MRALVATGVLAVVVLAGVAFTQHYKTSGSFVPRSLHGGDDHSGGGSGSGSGGNGDDSERLPGFDDRREISSSIDQSKREMRIESKSRTSSSKGSFRFEMKIEGFPRFRARFMNAADGTSTRFTFRMGFRRVFEFLPAVAGRADCYADGDSIFNKVDLVGLGSSGNRDSFRNRWSQINASNYVLDNVTWHEFVTVYQQPNNGASVMLKVQISESALKTNSNVTLTPNGVKVWVGVNNFRFNRTDTNLGIEAFVQSGSESRSVSSSVLEVGSSQGQLSWVNSMQSGNDTLEVHHSLPSSDDNMTDVRGEDSEQGESHMSRIVYCVSGNRTNYLWDPTITVGDTNASLFVRPSFLLAVLAVAVSLVTGANL